MASKLYSGFWVTVTAVITLFLLLYLFPLLLAKYGLVGALLGALLLIGAMVLAYLRGYWVSTWLAGRNKKTDVSEPRV